MQKSSQLDQVIQMSNSARRGATRGRSENGAPPALSANLKRNPVRLWLIERRIVSKTKQRFSDHRQNLIIVIVTYIKRKIAIDSLQRTGTIQTPGATRANAVLDCFFGQVLDYVTCPAAGDLGFVI